MEHTVVDLILQNAPGLAAMIYIIVFQGKEIKVKRTDNDNLKLENENLRLKNEALYMRIIDHFESAAAGKHVRISRSAKPESDE